MPERMPALPGPGPSPQPTVGHTPPVDGTRSSRVAPGPLTFRPRPYRTRSGVGPGDPSPRTVPSRDHPSQSGPREYRTDQVR